MCFHRRRDRRGGAIWKKISDRLAVREIREKSIHISSPAGHNPPEPAERKFDSMVRSAAKLLIGEHVPHQTSDFDRNAQGAVIKSRDRQSLDARMRKFSERTSRIDFTEPFYNNEFIVLLTRQASRNSFE